MNRWFSLIGIGLLAILMLNTDLGAVWARLSDADGALLVLVLVLNALTVFLKSHRWRVLMRRNGVNYPAGRALLAYWAGLFLGVVTPGRAGELLRIQPVCRDCKVAPSRVIPSLIADRVLDLYGLAVAATGVLIVGTQGASSAFWVIAGVGAITIGLGAALSPPAGRLAAKLGKAEWWHDLRTGLLGGDPKQTIGLAMLTVAAYGLFFAQCVLIARAIGLVAGIEVIILATVLGNLAAMVPVSISGLGTRDATIIAAMAAYGIASDQALAYSFSMFIMFNLFAALIGAMATVPLRKPKVLSSNL